MKIIKQWFKFIIGDFIRIIFLVWSALQERRRLGLDPDPTGSTAQYPQPKFGIEALISKGYESSLPFWLDGFECGLPEPTEYVYQLAAENPELYD